MIHVQNKFNKENTSVLKLMAANSVHGVDIGQSSVVCGNCISNSMKAPQPRLLIGHVWDSSLTVSTANVSQLEGEALASKGQSVGHQFPKNSHQT